MLSFAVRFLFATSSLFLLGACPVCAQDVVPAPLIPTSPDVVQTERESSWKRDIAPLFAKYCVSCHGGSEPKGDMRLEFASMRDVDARLAANRKMFELMEKYLKDREMPPSERPQPTDAERKALLDWLDGTVLAIDCQIPRDPGRVTARRLNRVEYANTIKDLLYLDEFTLADDFPPDDSGYGFDNNGDVLTMSPLLLEKYLQAAETALSQSTRNRAAAAKLREPVGDLKETFWNRQEYARKMFEGFLPRAFRRPVTQEEIERYMPLIRLSFAQDGENSQRAAMLAMRTALLSPEFLFRLEGQFDEGEGIVQLSEPELASRLSYFLWSTMPDQELFDLAKAGQLRANLEPQVRRMLAHPRSRALSENFAAQWLGLRSLAGVTPDAALFPNFSPELRSAMIEETTRFFDHIVRENRSILELLDADYTFLNASLAEHYSIRDFAGDGFQKTVLTDQRRGGLLTQASILTATSRVNRTAPVLRGKWILDNILDASPPPPPPNVPALEESATANALTLRRQLEKHRADAACAICHKDLDPLGLAFENYDAIGAWRDQEAGQPIDASGELPDGRKFQGPKELKMLLKSRSGEFRACLARKLMIYALGRGLEFDDQCAIEQICTAAEQGEDRFSSLVLAIVQSDPFQLRHSTGAVEP